MKHFWNITLTMYQLRPIHIVHIVALICSTQKVCKSWDSEKKHENLTELNGTNVDEKYVQYGLKQTGNGWNWKNIY